MGEKQKKPQINWQVPGPQVAQFIEWLGATCLDKNRVFSAMAAIVMAATPEERDKLLQAGAPWWESDTNAPDLQVAHDAARRALATALGVPVESLGRAQPDRGKAPKRRANGQ